MVLVTSQQDCPSFSFFSINTGVTAAQVRPIMSEDMDRVGVILGWLRPSLQLPCFAQLESKLCLMQCPSIMGTWLPWAFFFHVFPLSYLGNCFPNPHHHLTQIWTYWQNAREVFLQNFSFCLHSSHLLFPHVFFCSETYLFNLSISLRLFSFFFPVLSILALFLFWPSAVVYPLPLFSNAAGRNLF